MMKQQEQKKKSLEQSKYSECDEFLSSKNKNRFRLRFYCVQHSDMARETISI